MRRHTPSTESQERFQICYETWVHSSRDRNYLRTNAVGGSCRWHRGGNNSRFKFDRHPGPCNHHLQQQRCAYDPDAEWTTGNRAVGNVWSKSSFEPAHAN